MTKARKLLKKIGKEEIMDGQWIAYESDILRQYEKAGNTARVNEAAEYYQEILDQDQIAK